MSNARLEIEGQTIELPILTGTENEKAIDISTLRATTGYITMDQGFGNTGSCRSAITFLNGEQGLLKYRGITVEELCEKSHFIEVAYLLIFGKLPTQGDLDKFSTSIQEQTEIPEGIKTLIESFPKDAHPMGVLSSAVCALSGYYPEFLKPILNDDEKYKIMTQLIGQVTTMSSHFYRYSQGEQQVKADPKTGYCDHFLNQMFGSSAGEDANRALDVLFTLHADHEQNCSASSVRVVGSGQANLFASISAGINALWGPLHGGANQAVIEMLDAIQEDGGDAEKYLAKAKDKSDPFRLMGFGHRVYKNFDPRARIIKSYCDKVLSALGVQDPVLDIAKGLEETALKDPYFAERKLYPNVDFYSGIIYRAMKIPTNFFTVMFVIGRLPGWIAQWNEMTVDPKNKISRPRQIFTGPTSTPWKDISAR